jgi:hypothetical protein
MDYDEEIVEEESGNIGGGLLPMPINTTTPQTQPLISNTQQTIQQNTQPLGVVRIH